MGGLPLDSSRQKGGRRDQIGWISHQKAPRLAIQGKGMVDMPTDRKPFWWGLGEFRI